MYFNHFAQLKNLPVAAFSRGLEADAARNPGPVSRFAIDYLQQLKVALPEQMPFPVQLEEPDFEQAFQVIALDELEHRPMILRDFPQHLESVSFWSFPDIHVVAPGVALPGIRRKVEFLITSLKKATAPVPA